MVFILSIMPSFGKEMYKYLHHFAFNQLISSVCFQGLSDKDNMNSDSSNKGHKVRTILTTPRHYKLEWILRAAVYGWGLADQLKTTNGPVNWTTVFFNVYRN